MNPDPGPYLLLNQRVPWLPIVGPVFLFLNTYFSLFIISTRTHHMWFQLYQQSHLTHSILHALKIEVA